MNAIKKVRQLSCVLLAGLSLPVLAGPAAKGDHYDLLQTKTETYTNVTVMSATADLLSFSHSRGIGMVKVKELTDDEQIRLGFKEPPKPPVDVRVRAEVDQVMGRIDFERIKPYQDAWEQTVSERFQVNTPARNIILGIFGGLLVLYLLFCFCGKLICEKTGNKAGFLMWVPILQWIPLLIAAGMSPGWVLICLIPGLNIIAYLVWSVKITKARQKSGVYAFLLWLPVFNIISFLYLALSSSAAPKETKGKSPGRRIQQEGLEPAWYDGTA